MHKAGMLRFNKFSTWSFINAINGLITRHNPSVKSAGTWKQIDLPPPVGKTASVSFPSNTDCIISSCKGLKALCPQYCSKICCGVGKGVILFNILRRGCLSLQAALYHL